MRVEIEVNGTTHEVTIESSPEAGRYVVSWDGVSREVDARVVERDRHGMLLSLVRTDRGGAASRLVRCAPTDRTEVTAIRVGGLEIEAVINGSRARVAGGVAGGDTSGAGRLTAPMPGKVVRVLVAPGDAVEARQPLVVVEAMKMENELAAPRAGTVTEMNVSEGMSVEAGRLLATIE